MTEIIFIVHEPPEGGYAAEALGQTIFTVADTIEELNDMVRDAVGATSRKHPARKSSGSISSAKN